MFVILSIVFCLKTLSSVIKTDRDESINHSSNYIKYGKYLPSELRFMSYYDHCYASLSPPPLPPSPFSAIACPIYLVFSKFQIHFIFHLKFNSNEFMLMCSICICTSTVHKYVSHDI